MPFTPSHAAAVLPFLRTPLPASALVIGSIAPDLPYYLPVDIPWDTHTATALVTSDLLLGGLAWVVWHGVLAEPALAWAPGALRTRLTGVRPGLAARVRSVPAIVLVALALVVGAATHVLWDEFTHAGRWGTEHLPALAREWGPLPGYRWLQYASGVVGGVVLLLWLARWWRRAPRGPLAARPAAWPAWVVIAGSGLMAGVAGALTAPDVRKAAYAGATWGGGTALGVALVLAAAWQIHRRLRRSRAAVPRAH
ncbi:protein of unknown function [Blastococcus aurantiacus]|uniref:DUF4184 family protein n=1 Tax=Blastococcus aurantiacus TaxID=1550231 RepID=A0A1G7RNQ1_9ACTN|nr:DUF4184 family protein [Blastococcus aurantiacus]SDG12381.1 protein of unknown function [Blastococcus aurantiacus]